MENYSLNDSRSEEASEILYYFKGTFTNPIPEEARQHTQAIEIHSRQYNESTSGIRKRGKRISPESLDTKFDDECYMLEGHLITLDRVSQLHGRNSTRLIRIISDKLPEYHLTRKLVESLNLPLPS